MNSRRYSHRGLPPHYIAPMLGAHPAKTRSHWAVENHLHWCVDVVFADDQMRTRTGHAAHNLAVLRHITLDLIRLDPVKRKGGIKARRLIAAMVRRSHIPWKGRGHAR